MAAEELCQPTAFSHQTKEERFRAQKLSLGDKNINYVLGAQALNLKSAIQKMETLNSSTRLNINPEENYQSLLTNEWATQFAHAKKDYHTILKMIKSKQIFYIGLEMSDKEIKEKKEMADQVHFALEMEFSELGILNPELKKKLFLAIVGPVFFIQHSEPQVFKNIKLVGLDDSSFRLPASAHLSLEKSNRESRLVEAVKKEDHRASRLHLLEQDFKSLSFYYHLFLDSWDNQKTILLSKHPENLRKGLDEHLEASKDELQHQDSRDRTVAKKAAELLQPGLIYVDIHHSFSIANKLQTICKNQSK